jgi:hypothetical protein
MEPFPAIGKILRREKAQSLTCSRDLNWTGQLRLRCSDPYSCDRTIGPGLRVPERDTMKAVSLQNGNFNNIQLNQHVMISGTY